MNTTMPTQNQMSPVESLRVVHAARGEAIVVTAMGTAREWMRLEPHPLDFVYVPSSMGQATALGLGLALARPERRVIVCNGDGSTLMNLGGLVTISAQAAANFVLLIFDNGVYEVTGAQSTPGSAAARPDGCEVDFAAIVRACGFRSVFEFDDPAAWETNVTEVLNAPGPVAAVLKVAPVPGGVGPRSPGPAKERALRFAGELAKR